MANTRALEAGKAVIRGTFDTAAIDRTLRALQAKFAAFGAKLRAIGLGFAAVGSAITAPMLLFAKEAGDSEEALNKFRAVFGVLADDASTFADSLAKSVGRSADEIRGNLATFQSFFLGLGFDANKAAGLSKQMQQLALDFASFHNISDQEATERFIAAMSGSSEVLDKFGINTKQAALEAKLLEMGINKPWSQVTENEKAIARLAIIADSLGSQGAIGDAIKTAGSFNNVLKALQAGLADLRKEIGRALLPILTPVTQAIKNILFAAVEFAKQNQQLTATIFIVGAGIAAAGLALITLGGAFSLAGMAIGGLLSAASAVGAVLSAILSPIGLITVAIAGGTAAFLKFTQTGQNMTSQLVGYFQNLWGIFSQTFSAIKAALAGGDTEAAANVMWAGLEVAWLTGTAKVREITRTFYGWMLKVWTNSTSGLRSIWNGTTQFFADSLDVAGAAIVKSWNSTVAMLQKTWLRVKGLFGADVQGEIDRINSELQSTNSAIDANTVSQIGARDAAAQKAAADAERERQARLAEIDSNTDDALNAAKERQRAAQAAFSAAKDAAFAAGEAAAAQVSAATDTADTLMGGGGGGSTAAASLFDARYASQVFGGGGVQKQQLDVQRQMLAEQKRTRQQLEAAGVPVIP